MIHYKVLNEMYDKVRAEHPELTEDQAADVALRAYDEIEYQVFYGVQRPDGAKPVRVEIYEMCLQMEKERQERKAAKEERRKKWKADH